MNIPEAYQRRAEDFITKPCLVPFNKMEVAHYGNSVLAACGPDLKLGCIDEGSIWMIRHVTGVGLGLGRIFPAIKLLRDMDLIEAVWVGPFIAIEHRFDFGDPDHYLTFEEKLASAPPENRAAMQELINKMGEKDSDGRNRYRGRERKRLNTRINDLRKHQDGRIHYE